MSRETGEMQEQRFSVGGDSELSVSNVSGSVHVEANEGSEIVVRYRKTGSPKTLESTQVEVRQQGNRVSVQTRSGTAGFINFGRASTVDYTITVPRDCQVGIHTVSADVTVSGSRLGASIQTVNGDVKITDVAGDIALTTVSGDISAKDLSGTLLARTTSGDGQFLSSRLRRFNINTVSGDFLLETPVIADEHCGAKTVSGDLELALPADNGATIQLKSVSGSVSCEVPAEIIRSGRRHWQGRVNGGGGSVDMNSVSGDLKIRRSKERVSMSTDWTPVPPVPPVSPMQPAAFSETESVEPQMGDVATYERQAEEAQPESDDAETTAILQALERGEISVDEAMSKLS